jgi:hypothetical protein
MQSSALGRIFGFLAKRREAWPSLEIMAPGSLPVDAARRRKYFPHRLRN